MAGRVTEETLDRDGLAPGAGWTLSPILVRTRTVHRPVGPVAHDCERLDPPFGRGPAGMLMPWLDQLVVLSLDGDFVAGERTARRIEKAARDGRLA